MALPNQYEWPFRLSRPLQGRRICLTGATFLSRPPTDYLRYGWYVCKVVSSVLAFLPTSSVAARLWELAGRVTPRPRRVGNEPDLAPA